MSNLITGLDIGSSQIKGIVAEEKKDGTLFVVSAFKQPMSGLRRGMVVDAEDATQILRDLVLDLQKISKKATSNIFVNVNSEHMRTRHSKGIAAVSRADQEIQQDDVDRVMDASKAVKLLPNRMVLHNIIREYFVDDIGEIYQPIGMIGNRLEVATVMVEAFAPQVNLIVKTLERVGAQVGGLIFNPIAASRAILSKRQKDLGVVLVDLGFGTTSMIAYEENKITHARSLPIGMGYVTNDIAIGLKTSIDAAEKLKLFCSFALSKDVSRRETVQLSEYDATSVSEISKRLISEIVEVRLVEILDLIHNEFKSLNKNVQLPGGVVLTGGGAKTGGIADLVKQELKLPAQVGYPDLGSFEINNPTYENLINDTEFATAVGLTLFGNAESKKSISPFTTVKGFLRNLMP